MNFSCQISPVRNGKNKIVSRLLCSILSASVLFGCASADLSGFSNQTAALMAAVNEESQAVVAKMDDVIVLTTLAENEGWFEEAGSAKLASEYNTSSYVVRRRRFVELAGVIQQTLNAITGYSASLAELSAAGETGRDAVTKAVSTLYNIVPVLMGHVGPSSVVADIRDLITRAQRQKKIAGAMALLAGPNGALRKTVRLLQELLDTFENNFVFPLYDHIRVLERYRHGPGLIAFYNDSNLWRFSDRAFSFLDQNDALRKQLLETRAKEETRQAIEACFNDKDGCPQISFVSGLAAWLLLIDRVEDKYRSFEEAKVQIAEWRAIRTQRIARLKCALDKWADQHDAIFESIETCGGFKALKPGCGYWSEASLRLAIESIQQVVPDLLSLKGVCDE